MIAGPDGPEAADFACDVFADCVHRSNAASATAIPATQQSHRFTFITLKATTPRGYRCSPAPNDQPAAGETARTTPPGDWTCTRTSAVSTTSVTICSRTSIWG